MNAVWAAFQNGPAVDRFPTTGDGNQTGSSAPPPSASASFPSEPGAYIGIAGLAAGPDGTMWELETDDAIGGGRNWRLVTVPPPGAAPSNAPAYDGDGRPLEVGLGPNGVLVESASQSGTLSIRTYPYGAVDPPATRTFMPTSDVPYFGFAVAPDGSIYIPRTNGFDVYAASGTLRTTIVTDHPPTPYPGLFVIGADGSLYSAELVNYLKSGSGTSTMFVNVYGPGSGTAARRIGPLPVTNDPLGRPPVIAVGPDNDLYVATNGSIYVFDAGANGNCMPEHLMTYPASYGFVSALAIGP
ncbi:MAG: hypothetical protein JO036_19745 [Candidatus Eremiobacteraeota bacterium]|nr:hypothetical protein [Candidatus Eremiobacteraeota bacterium]